MFLILRSIPLKNVIRGFSSTTNLVVEWSLLACSISFHFYVNVLTWRDKRFPLNIDVSDWRVIASQPRFSPDKHCGGSSLLLLGASQIKHQSIETPAPRPPGHGGGWRGFNAANAGIWRTINNVLAPRGGEIYKTPFEPGHEQGFNSIYAFSDARTGAEI